MKSKFFKKLKKEIARQSFSFIGIVISLIAFVFTLKTTIQYPVIQASGFGTVGSIKYINISFFIALISLIAIVFLTIKIIKKVI